MKKPAKLLQFKENIKAIADKGERMKKMKAEVHTKRLAGRVEKIHARIKSINLCWEDIAVELTAIQQEREYEDRTFEDFIRREFGKSRDWGYKLIEAHLVVKSLPPNVDHGIQNERQARALKAAPVEKRAKVMEEVQAKGPVTVAAIEAAVKAEPVEAEFSELDAIGFPIPKDIWEVWERARTTASKWHGELRTMRLTIKKGMEDPRDVILAELTNSNGNDFKQLEIQIATITPHVVCPTCEGVKASQCANCAGRGFMSEYRYTRGVPKETRERREKKHKAK